MALKNCSIVYIHYHTAYSTCGSTFHSTSCIQFPVKHFTSPLPSPLRFHRSFSSSELRRYPLKDAATYWQCEDYPKAWGHGTREKPLPRQLNRSDPGPMRDRTVFRSSTFIPRLPKSSHPISRYCHTVYVYMYMNIIIILYTMQSRISCFSVVKC